MRARHVGLVLWALAGLAAGPVAAGTRWYIDPEKGSDLADGRSPETAFRHLPGDNRATGQAALVVPVAGDQLLLKGGTRYRGTVLVRTLATAEAPLVIDGSAWGEGPAVLDGSDPLPPARPCRSASDCLGAPHWRHLLRVRLPEGTGWSSYLIEKGQPLEPARWPGATGPLSAFAGRVGPEARAALDSGFIAAPLPASARSGEPVLALELGSGAVGYSPPVRLDDRGIHFERHGWLRWGYAPPEGEVRFALVNLPACVDRPGTYAISRQRQLAILWPSEADSRGFDLASGRQGLHVLGGGHIVLRGLVVSGFGGGEARDPNGGRPLVVTSARGPIRVEGLRAATLLDLHGRAGPSSLRLAAIDAPQPRNATANSALVQTAMGLSPGTGVR